MLTWRRLSSIFFISTVLISWLAAVVLSLQTKMSIDYIGSYEHRFFQVNKTSVYYILHLLEIICSICCGLTALINKNHKFLNSKELFSFLMMQITGMSWFAITIISDPKYTFMESIGSTGFLVWLSTIIVFSSVDPKNYNTIFRITPYLISLTLIILLWKIFNSNYVRIPGTSSELQLYIIYWWLFSFYYLKSKVYYGIQYIVVQLFFTIMIIGALYIQSRSWLLLSIIIYVLKNREIKRNTSFDRECRLKMSIFKMLSLALVFIVGFVVFKESIYQAVNGFSERLLDDSRSNQFVYFFDSVDWWQLILGLGPNGTWYWPGIGNYQYIDNGFLWMLFIGGVPLCISYLYFLFSPFLKSYFDNNTRSLFLNSGYEYYLVGLYLLMLMGLATYMGPSISFKSYWLYSIVGATYYSRENRVNENSN